MLSASLLPLGAHARDTFAKGVRGRSPTLPSPQSREGKRSPLTDPAGVSCPKARQRRIILKLYDVGGTGHFCFDITSYVNSEPATGPPRWGPNFPILSCLLLIAFASKGSLGSEATKASPSGGLLLRAAPSVASLNGWRHSPQKQQGPDSHQGILMSPWRSAHPRQGLSRLMQSRLCRGIRRDSPCRDQ